MAARLRHEEIGRMFREARKLDADQRAAFLERECAEDLELRDAVERLLDHDSSGHAFLGEPELHENRARMRRLWDEAAATSGEGLPERIGAYRILRRIGSGGMGVVYEAEQDSPRRRVALKVLLPQLTSSKRLARFRQEAELLGRLRDPGIAQVYEAGTFDTGRGPQPYFAMELVEGGDLDEFVASVQPPVHARLALLADVCAAVQHAHERGIVHRDLKPQNVRIDVAGRPKVLDFGVARATEGSTAIDTLLTEQGDLLGTIAYMAPEQLEANPELVTARADVYALGAIAFELMSGRPPHDVVGLPLAAATRLVASTVPARLRDLRPELPRDVETIVGKALEKEPSRRYASAAALEADLRAYLASRPIAARPPSRLYVAGSFARRHKGLVVGMASAFVATLIGLVAVTVLLSMEQAQRRHAEASAELARERERRVIGGALQRTQDHVESGRIGPAISALSATIASEPTWETRFLAGAIPIPLPSRYYGYERVWLDDRRLGVWTRDSPGLTILELPDWRVVERRFEGQLIELVVNHGAPPAWISLPERTTLLFLEGEDMREVSVARIGAVDDKCAPRVAVTDTGRLREFHPVDEGSTWITVEGGTELARTRLGVPCADVSVFISTDGERLVHLDGDRGELSIYDAGTGRLVGTPIDVQRGSCPLAWFDPGAREVMTTNREGVLASIDLDRSEIRRTFDCGPLWNCRFRGALSPDGSTFAFATLGSEIRFWDLTTDRLASTTLLEFDPHAQMRVSYSPNGQQLFVEVPNVTACVLDVVRGGAAASGGTAPDPRVVEFGGHRGYVYHVATSPDGRLVASMTPTDPLVHVWDAATAESLGTLVRGLSDGREYFRGELIAFSADGRKLVLTTHMPDGDGVELVSWDLLTDQVTREAPNQALGDAAQHQAWIDRFLLETRLGPGGRLGRCSAVASSRALALPVLGRAAEAGASWSPYYPSTNRREAFECLATSPDGTRAAVGDRRSVRILDTTSGEMRALFPGHTFGVAWSPDDRLIAAGGRSGRIRIYDAEFLVELLSFPAHEDYVYSLAWTPDGSRLISTSGDGTVRVWDARLAEERASDNDRYVDRVVALAGQDLATLRAAFDAASDADERGAIVRAAIELRR